MPNGVPSKLDVVIDDSLAELEDLRILIKTAEARTAIIIRRMKNRHANPMRFE